MQFKVLRFHPKQACWVKVSVKSKALKTWKKYQEHFKKLVKKLVKKLIKTLIKKLFKKLTNQVHKENEYHSCQANLGSKNLRLPCKRAGSLKNKTTLNQALSWNSLLSTHFLGSWVHYTIHSWNVPGICTKIFYSICFSHQVRRSFISRNIAWQI